MTTNDALRELFEIWLFEHQDVSDLGRQALNWLRKRGAILPGDAVTDAMTNVVERAFNTDIGRSDASDHERFRYALGRLFASLQRITEKENQT